MPSGQRPKTDFHDVARDAVRDVYTCAGMQMTEPLQAEPESAEYGACRFGLDGHSIAFRVAKTTPTKVGQFVTIWKRAAPGQEIAPLDITDDVQFVVISVADNGHRGQFIFSQALLLAKGIISRHGKGGKRAIRVYPPWSKPTAKDAIRTQQWQMQHFLPLAPDGTAEAASMVRMFFQG